MITASVHIDAEPDSEPPLLLPDSSVVPLLPSVTPESPLLESPLVVLAVVLAVVESVAVAVSVVLAVVPSVVGPPLELPVEAPVSSSSALQPTSSAVTPAAQPERNDLRESRGLAMRRC
jgi:hypothetical protein